MTPADAGPPDGAPDYPGQRLGRPESGPASIAPVGRRIVALGIDWAVALAVSAVLLDGALLGPNLVFGLVHVLLVGTIGATIGQRLLGMRVERRDGGWAGPLPALVRAVLLLLVVPALVWDEDQRGWHDRAAGTVLVRI